MRSIVTAALLVVGCSAAPIGSTRQALSSGGWIAGGTPMSAARTAHTATTLVHTDPGIVDAMGQVLVVGGYDASSTMLATTEMFHPETATWVPGPPLVHARAWHAAVLLRDYTVLVAGSIDAASARSVERFDPNRPSAGWIAQPSLSDGRALFTATALGDGTVLFAGGYDCAAGCVARASAERYTPAAPTTTPPGRMAPTASMSTARIGHTATRVPDGRVVVVGGIGSDLATTPASAEIYDPTSGTWYGAAPPSTGRYQHTATLSVAPDGTSRVIITGGFHCGAAGCQPVADVESYDPDADAWTTLPSLPTTHAGQTATLQERICRLTVAGGQDASWSPTASVEEATPGAPFAAAPALTRARYQHTANALADGSILVAGGYDDSWTATASWERSYLYDDDACAFATPSCAMPNNCRDSDGDGLSDVWETRGIDVDCDGVVDLDLRALGASPTHKDVFLQVDWMQNGTHSHRPSAAVLSQVVNAFAAAPVANPDGTSGINLHVVMGSNVRDLATTSFGSCDPASVDINVELLQQILFPAARRSAFHWALFAHYGCDGYQYVGGFAQYPGNSLYVPGYTVDGSGALVPASDALLAKRLLHELGHNLGLSHSGQPMPLEYGGNDVPNYQSVMGRGAAAGPIDYSRAALATLDEAALDEAVGTGAPSGTINYNCPGARCPGDGPTRCPTVAQPGPVDWNCNGVVDPAPVSADLDGDGKLSVLRGYDDWSRLVYSFQCSPSGLPIP